MPAPHGVVQCWGRGEWGQALRGTAAGARFRGVVDEVLGIEFAQPIQSERWPGAVAQQTLAPSAISGLDAHRAVHGEAAAVFPLPHRLRVIGSFRFRIHFIF